MNLGPKSTSHAGARLRRVAERVLAGKVVLGRSRDRFAEAAPSVQATLDIFRGEWTSRLPEPLADTRAGHTPVFEDARVTWAVERLGGVAGRTILELGPLEGGHSYMLDREGAASVVAVEGNTRAYLKCLVVKELLELTNVRFLYGDVLGYLRETHERYDICFASGVLYHLRNPAELIALTAEHADRLFVWTHYFDAARATSDPRLSRRITDSYPSEYRGFSHVLHRYRYGLSRRWVGFSGGTAAYSHWLSRADLLGCLEHFGWQGVEIGFDEPDHVNGPALAFTAVRR